MKIQNWAITRLELAVTATPMEHHQLREWCSEQWGGAALRTLSARNCSFTIYKFNKEEQLMAFKIMWLN